MGWQARALDLSHVTSGRHQQHSRTHNHMGASDTNVKQSERGFGQITECSYARTTSRILTVRIPNAGADNFKRDWTSRPHSMPSNTGWE